MGYNYTEAKEKFEKEWARNLKLYLEAGMSPAFIAAMREFDEAQFRKERTFQTRNPVRIQCWEDPRLEQPPEYFARLREDLDCQLEDICPGLAAKATERDKEVLLLSSIGLTQHEIAVNLHISQVAVLKHLHKLQKILQRGL